jgi:transposase
VASIVTWRRSARADRGGRKPVDVDVMPERRSPMNQDASVAIMPRCEAAARLTANAARRFGVSESSAIKWLERFHRDGARTPVGWGGHRRSALTRHREFLKAARAEKPHITLEALTRRLLVERGVKADTTMLSCSFRRIGVTLKNGRSTWVNRVAPT